MTPLSNIPLYQPVLLHFADRPADKAYKGFYIKTGARGNHWIATTKTLSKTAGWWVWPNEINVVTREEWHGV